MTSGWNAIGSDRSKWYEQQVPAAGDVFMNHSVTTGFARVVFAGLLLISLAACATVGARSDHDAQASFSGLNSFAWLPEQREAGHTRAVWDNDLLARRVQRAVRNTLTERGYGESDPDTADFVVSYTTDQRARMHGTSFGFGIGSYYRHSSIFMGQNLHLREREESVLIIDVINPDNEHLIWRGWATRDVTSGEFSERDVNRYVEAILKRFPPE